jgi:Protein of unknown function (DUF2970)
MNFAVKTGKTIRAVLWSFLGVRKGAGFQDDIATLTPFHILGVGIGLCFMFVFGLMLLVHCIVKI